MKALPLILACFGSGIAGGVALKAITPAEAQADSGQEDLLASLRDEIVGLRDQSRMDREDFEERLARMENETLLVSPAQERSFVPEESTGSITDGNLPLASSKAIQIGNSVIQPEQFEAWVQRASESLAAKKKTVRDQERSVREGERMEVQIAKLTTDLGLDQHQQSEFRRHLQDSNTKRRDTFQAMRDGSTDRTAMRETMNTLREENDADLRTFLNEDQFTSYKESNSGGFGRGARNNVGGGGGNNSRGGGNRGSGN
ncbi:MAG: hypothetical protein GY930_20060 [bacterium]|nr:hypothetical protein [bacterium]